MRPGGQRAGQEEGATPGRLKMPSHSQTAAVGPTDSTHIADRPTPREPPPNNALFFVFEMPFGPTPVGSVGACDVMCNGEVV